MLQPKRLISLTLALLLVCSLLPTAAFAQDTCAHEWVWDEEEGPFYQWCTLCDEEQALEEITGTYGKDSSLWTVTPDGTLTISGSGDFTCKGEVAHYGAYITDLVIGEQVSDVYWGDGDEFTALSTITVDKANPRYYAEDNVLFDRNENLLVIYPQQKQNATYTVPGHNIGRRAFSGNQYLQSVTVEEGAVFLDGDAFYNCKNLSEISLPLSLEEVQQRALPGTLETVRYAGSETQWNRIYIHPSNDLSAVDVEFGVSKSDITAQWNLKHTILNLKGEAEGASYVLANFYQPGGQMIKSILYTAQQVADGVAVNDPDTNLSDCSAKIVVLDSAFAPIYDCTVPDGDVDHAALATFEGVLYQVDAAFRLKPFDEAKARMGELLFSNGEDVLVVDTVRMFDLSYRDLGQRYTVTYNWQTNDLISLENTGVSVTGTARLDEVEYRTVTENDTETHFFTFGKLENLPFDSDSVPYLMIDDRSVGRGTYSAKEMAEKTYSASADEYTAVDSDNDGDIDGLFIHVIQYAQVTRHGTDKKKGDYMDLMFVGNTTAGRYYLGDDLFGPDKLPDDLKDGDIIKIFWAWDVADTHWEILPSETMTFEKLSTAKGRYTFDGRTFTLAENGWDLSDSLINANLGRDFTIAYDGDLVVWAEADIVPLDAAEIYTDGDQIDPDAKDAVELMYALGLMGSDEDAADTVELLGGDAKGNFHPERAVTRAEMAKIIYIILNYGEDDSATNYRGANIFSDVEPGSWYEGYVNYCATIKLIQGQDDGTFGPDEAISGVKAAKMLLTAIGYDAEDRGYVGDGWEHQVLADASILGLLEGYKANTADPAPRQWLAKMVENCLLKCTDAKNVLMGEKYFKLTEDSEVYRMVYADADDAPDITVKAGVGELVDIDWEVFQDYLEEDLDSTKYDVAYVTISNPPCSDAWGYLVTDGEELTTKGDKTFYIDPSKSQYDLEDLQYQAGEKKGTHKATFKVYYYKTSSSTTATATTEGIIKFDVTSAATDGTLNSVLFGTIKAAQVMNFADSLTAFKNLGSNDNIYITIDTLPKYGRLVYKFGLSGQQDVTVGKEYYLNGESGKLLLSKVTYVPAYSADKTIKTDSFAVTGFSAGDNEVEGTVNLTIEHAQKSARFTDVTDSYYADSVDFLYNQNISTGMTASTFGLTGNVTRGQFVTFLYRAAGSPYVTGVTNPFADVKRADYYYNAVMWAVKHGLIADRSTDTEFYPNANTTHQEIVTFLYHYYVKCLGHTAAFGSASYVTDFASVDSWAQDAVKWAAYIGILDYGAMQPKNAATRGTVALWLHRAFTLGDGIRSANPDPDPEPTPNPDPDTCTVLARAISHTSESGAVSLDVVAPDGSFKTLYVTEVDGESPSVTEFAVPAFYEAAENENGEASLTHITRDFEEYGIYAGQVSKYTYRTETATLNDGTELTAAETFTLYDGSFDEECDSLEEVSKKTPYIFFAPEGEAVYGVTCTPSALNDLFVRLGGLQDTAADYGDSYFIDPDAHDAINLLYDIDLMKGDGKGNFRPEGTVTRAEVAKMIYEILHYGEDDRGEAYTDLNLFTDVASADWYSGYVNYCASMGLISGKADGTFAPYETVTCPQMAKILLMAISYDAEARGYVGANWDEAVLSDAAILDLLKGYKYNVNTVVPRQWMAVMIANALRNCYTYTGDAPVQFTTPVTKEMAAADRRSYVLMGDKYYGLGLDPEPELTLLVDGYCETNRNGKVYAVDAMVNGEVGEYDVDPNSEIAAFIDDSESSNSWGLLIPYAGDENATTNVAEYFLDDDGVISLFQTQKTFIDLYEEDAESSKTAYYGDYTDENGELLEDVRVQASKNTVFYYVDANRNVETVTGYKKSYAVTDAQHGIRAMYTVATNVDKTGENPFFVADIIVIETEESVTQPVSQSLVLVYDYSINTKGVVTMDVFAADGTRQSLTVDEINGRDPADERFSTPAFYDSILYSNGVRTLESVKYPEKRGACAGVVESFDGADVILSDGTTLTASADGFTHYRYYWNDNAIFAESNLLTSLYPKEPYIFYAPDGEAVYAIQASSPDLRELYGTAGGHRPETDATTLFLDGSTVDPAARDAVELMYELGLMNSNGKGYFHPDATFTRAEMAKLIYGILNYGIDDGAVNYRGATFFSDVEADSWYEGYVNYCASIKLIQGQDGTFGPNEAISGVKAAKMLLTAIGYSAEERGYIPGTANWEDNVLCDAEIIGLLEDYCGPTTSATSRQWVAKLVENCMNCLTYDKISPPIGSPLPPTEPVTIPMGEKYFDLTEDSEIYRRVYNVMTEPEVILGYSVTNKTTADYVSLDAVDADAVLQELAVVELDGENAKDAEFAVPAFFLSTENADGEAALTTLTEDFGDYGICAATVTKVNNLYEYVTTEEDEVLYFYDEVVVYDLTATTRYMKLTTEDENGDQLELTPGQSYILIADGEDIVYALLVQNADDPAAALYAQISGRELASPAATVTVSSPVDVFVNGVVYTAPIEAKIGDALTLEFAAEVIVSATGATCTMGESLQTWTVTVTESTVAIIAAQ